MNLSKLLSGYKLFKATDYQEYKELIEHMVRQGQKPSTLIVACSDMRVAPGKIFSSLPGETFVMRNIGGLVPPYHAEGTPGVTSAIEYAVAELKVDNVIVIGHADCHATHILMHPSVSEKINLSSVQSWLSVASEASDAVKNQLSDMTSEQQEHACEQEMVVLSLRNLLDYPCVKIRLEDPEFKILGMHFDISSGDLLMFDPDTGFFEPLG